MNMQETSTLMELRRQKLEECRLLGINPFPNDFKATHTAAEIAGRFKDMPAEEVERVPDAFRLAGRIMSLRNFGKAVFMHLQDGSGRIQAYLQKGLLSDGDFSLIKKLDVGDFIGIEGTVFITRTGELTIKTAGLKLLVKSLRPLPEKWHGLSNIEIRYRQRYLDLIMNPEVKAVFLNRARAINLIRSFLQERGFVEVETPMMQAIPGGATARPFQTYHNTYKLNLYLRISPELYLKRLLVGGMDRVFEINRNFRNEGVSTHHNPEFTMLEFYQAYATYEDCMDLTEELICHLARSLLSTLRVPYLDGGIDFTPPWPRLTMEESIVEYAAVDPQDLTETGRALRVLDRLGLTPTDPGDLGNVINDLFENMVQPRLTRPTFITSYPTSISPLARHNDENPDRVDRFELFINGQEIANAFSELNDPVEQYRRFKNQTSVKTHGEGEGRLDEDFIEALEYGMPPAAGEGIGIDRLVMLLCNAASIRDVILFPLLKPER
jgi:lysyl-tRNA synthetase class 2